MSFTRLVAVALVCGSALELGACSNTVADMWPHWAGGEPAGLPPRPGQPGYEEFIAHGQPNQNPDVADAATQQAPAGATATIAEQKSAAPPPGVARPRQESNAAEAASEPAEHPANDTGVVQGGLY